VVDNRDEIYEGDERRFRVVAALIRKGSRILLTQRWPGKHAGLTWEFPGGKVEAGETDHEALQRELSEELGIEVEIGSCCFETCHGYGNREVHLLIYRCRIVTGEPQAIDVKAVDWTDVSELPLRNFPPADAPFVQELVAGRIKEFEDDEKAQEPELEAAEEEFKPAKVVRRPT
jgi:8-oxo-dGTP diphosphatase